jgi:hypothetical protein
VIVIETCSFRKQIAYPEIYAKKTLRTGIAPGDKFRIQIPVFRIQLPGSNYRYSGSSYRNFGSSYRYSGFNYRYSGSSSRYFGSSFTADLSDERGVGVGRPHVLAPVELPNIVSIFLANKISFTSKIRKTIEIKKPVLVDVSVQVRLVGGAVAATPAPGGGGGGGGGVPGG